MYSLAWLVVVGVVGAVVGSWLGHLAARVRSKSAERIAELEAELESARGELSDYRHEVFDQFAATASKFRSLDESYNDLHRQLAQSASLLCGEAAGPFLEAPPAQAALAPTLEEPGAVDDGVEEEKVPILVAEVSQTGSAPATSNGDGLDARKNDAA